MYTVVAQATKLDFLNVDIQFVQIQPLFGQIKKKLARNIFRTNMCLKISTGVKISTLQRNMTRRDEALWIIKWTIKVQIYSCVQIEVYDITDLSAIKH